MGKSYPLPPRDLFADEQAQHRDVVERFYEISCPCRDDLYVVLSDQFHSHFHCARCGELMTVEEFKP